MSMVIDTGIGNENTLTGDMAENERMDGFIYERGNLGATVRPIALLRYRFVPRIEKKRLATVPITVILL